ncbi:MAG: patatin [Rhodospirillaceae bacterium]|nr:MAG: patatin [Rhodospirillaceae bacterium]
MTDQPFQILVLPGGGFLGLHTAVILDEIEKQIGHPIGQHFDLIAGTSVGGLIALAVAAEIPASELVSMFENQGPMIFKKKRFWSGFFSSKFSQTPLKNALDGILGDRILGEVKHNVVIPVLNLSKGGPSMFKTPHHESFKQDWKFKLVDVGLATSAAPIMFPLAEVDGRLFSDGAFFANSPELVALHEANEFLDISDKEIRILTIGTTNSSVSQGHSKGKNWGVRAWVNELRIIEFMMASQVSIVREMVRHRLGDKYCVVDSDRGKYSADEIGISTTDGNAIKTLKAMGKEAAKSFLGSPDFNTFINHTPSAPMFFHGPQAPVMETNKC